jgi:hypothetical protein
MQPYGAVALSRPWGFISTNLVRSGFNVRRYMTHYQRAYWYYTCALCICIALAWIAHCEDRPGYHSRWTLLPVVCRNESSFFPSVSPVELLKIASLISNMLSTIAVGIVTIFGLLHLLLHWIHDAKEPPVAPTSIPFLGHVVGLARKKSRYYVELRLVNP